MEALTFATILTLIWKLVSFIKYLTSKDWNGVVTQATVWVAGVVVLFLAANASITEGLEPWAGKPLGSLDAGSIILAGILAGSAAAGLYDIAGSPSEPKLLKSAPPDPQ